MNIEWLWKTSSTTTKVAQFHDFRHRVPQTSTSPSSRQLTPTRRIPSSEVPTLRKSRSVGQPQLVAMQGGPAPAGTAGGGPRRKADSSLLAALARRNDNRFGLAMIYTDDIYFLLRFSMPKTDIAKLFQNGRSQAVRLPKEFRFEGDRVRIRRVAQGVLLEPLIPDTARWFEELDRFKSEPFLARGRRQPVTPRRRVF